MWLSEKEQDIFNSITSEKLDQAVFELRRNSNFSFSGLKELHDTAFKSTDSLPENVRATMDSYFPMRPEREDWKKRRDGITPFPYDTFYSPLEKSDFANAERAIDAAKPEKMLGLTLEEKVKRLVDVYAELDYLHAFWDGNSRVNRVFVRELASQSGVNLDFEKIDRKEMYVARDKSLAELNLQRRAVQLKSIKHIKSN